MDNFCRSRRVGCSLLQTACKVRDVGRQAGQEPREDLQSGPDTSRGCRSFSKHIIAPVNAAMDNANAK